MRRGGEVGGVQAIDLRLQGGERAGVVDHVVGGGQALRAVATLPALTGAWRGDDQLV